MQTTRVYHENKAKRCLENLTWMNKKLKQLEGPREEKIDNLKKEIAEINRSLVTLRCAKPNCGKQFTISFARYKKGSFRHVCDECKEKEDRQFISTVKEIFDIAGIKYELGYKEIRIPFPNKDL